MRRFRNPRYAPEALERKLHPSGLTIPVTAEFATAARSTFGFRTEPPPSSPDPNDPSTPTPTPTPSPSDPWDTPPVPHDPDAPA